MSIPAHQVMTVALERTDNAPLTFTGELLAEVVSSPNDAVRHYSGSPGRWQEISLFRTVAGKYICYKVDCSQWRGEATVYETHVADNEAEVQAFFGWGRLAKELYAETGITIHAEHVQ